MVPLTGSGCTLLGLTTSGRVVQMSHLIESPFRPEANGPDNMAPQILRVLKPLYHNMVAVPEGLRICI